MNLEPANPFGQGRYSSEAEDLYRQFKSIYDLPELVALSIALHLPCQAGQLAKDYFGRPAIRYLVIKEPVTTYALALVKACVNVEQSLEQAPGQKLPIPLPLNFKRWVETIELALALNDGGATARKKAGASLHACVSCKQWKFEGHIDHLPNCPAEAWRAVKENQSHRPSPRQQEKLKVDAAIVTAKTKSKIGPLLNAPAPKKSKPHPHSSWPPIVPGGAVERNRRKF
jgi:hypothetical protein